MKDQKLKHPFDLFAVTIMGISDNRTIQWLVFYSYENINQPR